MGWRPVPAGARLDARFSLGLVDRAVDDVADDPVGIDEHLGRQAVGRKAEDVARDVEADRVAQLVRAA